MFTRRAVVSGARVANSGNVRKSRFTASLAIAALWVGVLSTSTAYAQTGWVRNRTGLPCDGTYCQFWEDMDRNGVTARIAASGGNLYQLQITGAIFKAPTTPCTYFCPGWGLIGYNAGTKAVYADGSSVYQLRDDGSIWRYLGTPDSWQWIGGNALSLGVGGGKVYRMQPDGEVWEYVNGQWYLLSWFSNAVAITVSTTGRLYQLNGDGAILRYTPGAPNSNHGWELLDNNPATVGIVAGGDRELYQLHNNGAVWHFTGALCNGFCPGWELLENPGTTVRIAATNGELYRLHNNGALLRYTFPGCGENNCAGWAWELLMPDGVGRVAADGSRLYEINQPASPMIRQRVCDQCR